MMSVEPEQTTNEPAMLPALSTADHLLEMLVEQVNRVTGLTFGVSLQVGGILVSGSLIGGSEYFDAFTEQVSAGFTEEVRDSYREVFTKFGSVYKQEPEESDPPPRFIHLKDAKFYAANANPVLSAGVLWRGRISEVSGFTMGTITPTK